MDLSIEGELGLSRAVDLKQQLFKALEKGGSLVLDLSRVTAVDTAGVQLLLLLRRAAEAKGVPLRLASPSEAVGEVLRLLRLDPELQGAVRIVPRTQA